MANFTIGEAWSQAMATMKAHWQPLAIAGAVGSGISAVLTTIVSGGGPEQLAQQIQAAMAGGDPTAVFTTMGPLLLIAGLGGAIISSIAQFAAYRTAVTNGGTSLQDALPYASRAGVITTLFFIVVGFGLAIVFGLLFALIGIGGSMGSGDGMAGMLGALGLLAFILIPVALWLAARLMVVSPAMADSQSTNPIQGIAASWRLTGPSQWNILGYILLLIVAAIVVFAILGIVLAAFAFLGSVGAIVSAVIQGAVQSVLGVSIGTGVYRTLVPAGDASIFS